MADPESDDDEANPEANELESDSETEGEADTTARKILEQVFASVDQPTGHAGPPHVKRWEGEPEPSVATADLWRNRAKAGNFKEVKMLRWRSH